jgi:hypothetical protein
MFPAAGEGKETHILLAPLERANLNHWTQTMGKVHKSERYNIVRTLSILQQHVHGMFPFQLIPDFLDSSIMSITNIKMKIYPPWRLESFEILHHI